MMGPKFLFLFYFIFVKMRQMSMCVKPRDVGSRLRAGDPARTYEMTSPESSLCSSLLLLLIFLPLQAWMKEEATFSNTKSCSSSSSIPHRPPRSLLITRLKRKREELMHHNSPSRTSSLLPISTHDNSKRIKKYKLFPPLPPSPSSVKDRDKSPTRGGAAVLMVFR